MKLGVYRRVCIALLALMIIFAGAAYLLQGNDGPFTGILITAAIVDLIVLTVLDLLFCRCPYCGRHLSRKSALLLSRCYHCGEELYDETESIPHPRTISERTKENSGKK